jgi:hypothetical protein
MGVRLLRSIDPNDRHHLIRDPAAGWRPAAAGIDQREMTLATAAGAVLERDRAKASGGRMTTQEYSTWRQQGMRP